ncbi:Histidine kinase [Curvularia kusanoi]|uniref:histidine kinase n=1 Tax=Curvularia kusanoi TaxID=90978 RepID=A0A9P4TB31_CURKU|nr:Histidine kinase [Curvularia kusanoi]
MRVAIREQLSLLVFLATSISLTVITLASWYTNHSFVLDVRSDALMLTASLKAAQLSSSLLLMQILVKQVSSRVVPQRELEQYYSQNYTTSDFWDATASDYDALFSGDKSIRVAVQARIYHKESSDRILFSRTASGMMNVTLPCVKPDGQPVLMGDERFGYLPELFPKFNVSTIDRSLDQYEAEYEGRLINRTEHLLLGPYKLNDSLTLLSITMPIVNTNISNPVRTIGWLTLVVDAQLISNVLDAREGLGRSGLTLLFGPDTATNTFPNGYLFETPDIEAPEHVEVQFEVPPAGRLIMDDQQGSDFGKLHFDWAQYPAVRQGFTRPTHNPRNAGSMVSTKNEQGNRVGVGYAIVNSSMVDWMIVIERSHAEIWSPIDRLRRVILACVFGTMAVMLLITLPITHYFSRTVRQLRDATKGTVLPQFSDSSSWSNSSDHEEEPLDQPHVHEEHWFDGMFRCRGDLAMHHEPKRESKRRRSFHIPKKIEDRRHFLHDELTDLIQTFNEMTDELTTQYQKLEERVQQRTAELEIMKEAAEAANESKTLFIANLSHELKTPLNGIMGMCAVCMSEDDPNRLKKSLELLYKSGELLLKLLTDLLTFSKNEIGHPVSLEEKEFTLKDISSQILAIFSKQAEEAGISLSVNLQGGNAKSRRIGSSIKRSGVGTPEPVPVEELVLLGDEYRIVQVILNLVSNSLKFTPAGGSVIVTARCTGEVLASDMRRASAQSRGGSLSDSKARASTTVIGGGPALASTQSLGRPKSRLAHRVEGQRGLTPPKERWLNFEFQVEDTGPGIPSHLHSKIFEPFVQGDLGLNKKYAGTGLGLSICSQIAGVMGGSMRLKSELGHGSIFVLSIPLKNLGGQAEGIATGMPPTYSSSFDDSLGNRSSGFALSMRQAQATSSVTSRIHSPLGTVADTVASEISEQPSSASAEQPLLAPAPSAERPVLDTPQANLQEQRGTSKPKHREATKVLVAEDNMTNQVVMKRMLKLEGLQNVTIAVDGQDALEKVNESLRSGELYDLVFMDVQMPNLDGIETTRMIRKLGFGAPIVALTAYTEETNVQKCLDSGMNFFLSKPINRSAIKQVLIKYCLA